MKRNYYAIRTTRFAFIMRNNDDKETAVESVHLPQSASSNIRT
jgi:hypothetical protein